MTIFGERVGPWVTLLLGLAAGYTAGAFIAKSEDQMAPLLYYVLYNAALPGIFIIGVTAFLTGCYALEWLWTRLIWLWMKHKHQVEIREHLRASGQVSEHP